MDEISDNEHLGGTVPPTSKRRRKKKSMVWEHFTIEAGAGGSTRACCNLCKQTFAYSSGSKVAGTSHLKRHIALGSCPKIKSQEKEQLALTSGENVDGSTASRPAKRRYRYTGFANASFDQGRSCSYLAKMIIMNDYPLHLVEQPAFVTFIESVQPRFRMVDSNTIEAEVLALYQKEKYNLMQAFSTMPGRINLTIELWTTNQSLGYVSLAAQFIDANWMLHRRMLNFVMVSCPHSENALSEAIGTSLAEWNLKEKLFAITLDDGCSSHDIYSSNLRDHLSNKSTLAPKGQLFVVRCYSHILNAVAQDMISSIHGIVYNIRESIKYVKASPAHEDKFAGIVLQLNITIDKELSLDSTMQWDTTYNMLLGALDLKPAFTILETCDDNYNEAPSADDWRKVEVVCTYLKLLHDSANVIMSVPEQTANIFFQEACKILVDLKVAMSHVDSNVIKVAKDMHEKFDKYWKDSSLVLAMAIAMDPRFKLKLVEFSFSKVYDQDSEKYVKLVNDAIHELYNEYVTQPLPLTPAYVEQGDVNTIHLLEDNPPSTPGSTSDGLADFERYLSEIAVKQPTKSELEQYLEESLVPRAQEFDVLNWWKLNTIKYPTLSMMARDILAIPLSMVSVGGCMFSMVTGSRVLDDYRSSLRPETVEALVCSKDWLQYFPTVAEEAPLTAMVKMEY